MKATGSKAFLMASKVCFQSGVWPRKGRRPSETRKATMAIAALSTRSLTQYRAGRRPLPSGTGPAARPAALAALNDAPHRPAATALLDHAAEPVAARIHFENRP